MQNLDCVYIQGFLAGRRCDSSGALAAVVESGCGSRQAEIGVGDRGPGPRRVEPLSERDATAVAALPLAGHRSSVGDLIGGWVGPRSPRVSRGLLPWDGAGRHAAQWAGRWTPGLVVVPAGFGPQGEWLPSWAACWRRGPDRRSGRTAAPRDSRGFWPWAPGEAGRCVTRWAGRPRGAGPFRDCWARWPCGGAGGLGGHEEHIALPGAAAVVAVLEPAGLVGLRCGLLAGLETVAGAW
ncbi:hypothetical protein NDU88_005714 [Pleurodeles waltl]|uniref:Uncharacterized protein n=1 Tax=Pleurodeles waltl TaxID=8319 RepID=A0AAV7WZG2_PLEWA|nr:hypothetical protein NDU88_005714 [Pleurodeles waltl]